MMLYRLKLLYYFSIFGTLWYKALWYYQRLSMKMKLFSLKQSLVRMTTSRRSVSCRKLLLLKLQMFSILIIFLGSVPQKVLADHPYTFVKPLPNVDTASSKIIQHQPSKNTYNIAPDSFHRRERSGLFLGWIFLANFLFLQ